MDTESTKRDERRHSKSLNLKFKSDFLLFLSNKIPSYWLNSSMQQKSVLGSYYLSIPGRTGALFPVVDDIVRHLAKLKVGIQVTSLHLKCVQ